MSNKSSNIDIKSVELEHIYPQKPCADWASLGGWPGTSEEQNKYIYSIGNQFILNGKVNNKIKNKYITEKIEEYKKISGNDIALNTSMNQVDFHEFEKNGKNYIVSRQAKIAEIIHESFPLAKNLILK